MTTASVTTPRQTEVAKEPLPYREGHRYALLTDDKGTTLSVHDDQEPGLVWISGNSTRGYSRAARLDLEQAIALREALGLWIADHSQSQT